MKVGRIFNIILAFMLSSFVLVYGITLPSRMNAQTAHTFMQAHLSELTGKQIAECLKALESENTLHAKGCEMLDGMQEANQRYFDYVNTESEEEDEAEVFIDEGAFQTIGGLADQMTQLTTLKNSDAESYLDVIARVSTSIRRVIDVWFFLEKSHFLDEEALKEALENLKSRTTASLAREALEALSIIKKACDIASVFQVLNVFRSEIQKFNFICAFFKASKDVHLVRLWRGTEHYLGDLLTRKSLMNQN